ncbi:outer membrane protein assembly factor BamB family protein [Amycolatopsis sp. NBC_01480]|uniref:outer membrane protein assembly factor BamB family protein n=1 Tax=Amycolatopsis sp. NBC_01480 TaxID=2903562 RepID=UPI002E2D42EE|nr:PQQ-binding-like beta-propeller repeat protein [Amycolatopsis sp. NBC_01480]
MRRVPAILTCLAVVITAGGCSSGPSPQSPRSPQSDVVTPSRQPPAAKTADPPTAFDAAAGVALPTTAFSTNIGGSVTARFLTLRDRTAYIVAPTGLTAVDVLTGKQQWAAPIEGAPADPNNQSGPFVNTSAPRPPVVTDKLAAAAVPVQFPEQGTTPGYVALTVLAADATTGKKAWQADTKVSTDEYADATNAVTKVVGVTDKAVVASYEKDEAHITVGLDPATGKTLWTRPDYTGGSVHGDVLAGVQYNKTSSTSQITALDVVTGQEKWTAAKDSYSLDLVSSDPALVVVDQKAQIEQNVHGGTFLVFLDPATGAEKARLTGDYGYAASSYGDCFYDQQSVLTCSASGVLTGYDAATARKLWSLPDQAANRVAPGVLVAWHGVLYGTTQGGKAITLDAKTGKDLSTEVGVEPYWVSEYAAIGVSDGDNRTPMAYPVKK